MDFDSYKMTLPYPSKIDFRTTYWYRGGKLVAERKGQEEAIAHVSGLRMEECVKEVVIDEDAYKRARTAYNDEAARLHEQFKADLFADLDIADHPLRDKLFAKAWEDGHSAGYEEVYICASNLKDLIDLPVGHVLVGPNCTIFGSALPARLAALANQLAKELAYQLAKELTK